MPIKSEDLKRPNRPAADASDRLNQTREAAQKAADQTKISLVNAHQQRLVALNAALDKAEERREEAVERFSDRVAYLQDDSMFLNDVLRRSQEKQQQRKSTNPEREAVTETAFDALIEVFEAVADDWDIPQIAPSSSPMGCLPIS